VNGIYVVVAAVTIFGAIYLGRSVIRRILSGTYKAGEKLSAYTPSNFSLPEPTQVEFMGEQETILRGRYWPGTNGCAIVVVHGVDGPSIEMMPHVSYLNRAGYGVLIYDNRGRGESGGGFSTLGYYEWRDVLHAVKWTAAQPGVDPANIGLHGMSLGAACVILAAAENQQVRGVLAESPFISMPIMLAHVANKVTRVPRQIAGWVLRSMLDWSLGARLRTVAPEEAVERIAPRPLYIIDAEKDLLFPANTSRSVYQSAGEPKYFWVVEGAPHANCWHTLPHEYETRALNFWENVFAESPPAAAQHEAVIEEVGARD